MTSFKRAETGNVVFYIIIQRINEKKGFSEKFKINIKGVRLKRLLFSAAWVKIYE